MNEESPIKPQTFYAICKTWCERDLKAMGSDAFIPIFLRNATAFGASPRQRFDLVLNNLSGFAYTTGEIKMISDGTPWRPLVHALDTDKAIRCALESPRRRDLQRRLEYPELPRSLLRRDRCAGAFPDCRLSFGRSIRFWQPPV